MDDAAQSGRPIFRTGSLVVIGLVAFFVLGWFVYSPYIPKTWLRDLAKDITERAAVDPDAPPPEDMRQASPQVTVDSPYICVAKLVRIPWDRFIVVGQGQDPRATPALASAHWNEGNVIAMAEEMTRDPRYQYIVLIKDNAVVDAQLFFTFWGDLSALARPEGFTREDAIFTAARKGDISVVSPAENAPPDTCR